MQTQSNCVIRRAITVPGQPLNARSPHMARVGDFVFSSGIYGRGLPDGTTGVYVQGLVQGRIETDPERQVVRAFQTMQDYLRATGADLENLGLLTVHLRDESLKPIVYREWDNTFPPDRGPAGHLIVPPSFLDPNTHVSLDFIAQLGAVREAMVIPNAPRYGSIPHVARLGDVVYVSGVNGLDYADGSREQSPAVQMANAYDRVKQYVEAAGCTIPEVGFIRNYVRYRNNRELMNPEFARVFGAEFRAGAPARSTHVQPNLAYPREIEISNVMAVRGSTEEGAYVKIDWVRPHGEPISDTARRSNLLFSSRIAGREQADWTNEERLEPQVVKTFESLQAHIESAGATLDNIGRIDMWVDTLAAKLVADREWDKMFGGRDRAPACHIHHQSEGLVPGWYLRMEFIAVV